MTTTHSPKKQLSPIQQGRSHVPVRKNEKIALRLPGDLAKGLRRASGGSLESPRRTLGAYLEAFKGGAKLSEQLSGVLGSFFKVFLARPGMYFVFYFIHFVDFCSFLVRI